MALTTVYRQYLITPSAKFACGMMSAGINNGVQLIQEGRSVGRVSITYIFSIPARPFAWHNLADVELLRAIVSLTRQSSLWCPHGELLQLPLISSAVSSANGPLASCIFSLFDLFLAASNILLATVPVAQRAHYHVASAPLRRGEGYGGEVSS